MKREVGGEIGVDVGPVFARQHRLADANEAAHELISAHAINHLAALSKLIPSRRFRVIWFGHGDSSSRVAIAERVPRRDPSRESTSTGAVSLVFA